MEERCQKLAHYHNIDIGYSVLDNPWLNHNRPQAQTYSVKITHVKKLFSHHIQEDEKSANIYKTKYFSETV